MRYTSWRVILVSVLVVEICSILIKEVNFVNWGWFNKELSRETSSSPSSPNTVVRHVSLVNTSWSRSGSNTNSVDSSGNIRINHTVGALPLCSRQQVIDGRWEPAKYDDPPYTSMTIHLQCQNNAYYEEHGYETFDWRPNQACEFLRWNSTSFCHLVKRATVSIIGDSLSWEMYSSLLQLLGVPVQQLDQHRSRVQNRNHILEGCHKRETRFVYRNDARLEVLRDSIKHDFPLILILNRGAHYVNNFELIRGMRETIEVLHEWRATCARLGVSCHLFWRTTVPGHPHCERYQQPDNRLERVEELIANSTNYDKWSITYHWYDFQSQNNIILQMLEDSGLNATVLDAYYLNVRRLDGHRPNDCLHNCYPGKMDVLNQLFLHFLTLERSDKDVEHLLNWQAYETLGAQHKAAKQNGSDIA